MLLLLLLLPLSCWIVAGLKAEDPPEQHHGLINNTVCLHVRLPPPYQDGQWKFDKKTIVSPSALNPKYEEKVFFSRENLSLCIKNLEESDAGVYEVSFNDPDYNSMKERHQIIVQGMVPQPVIAVHASNVSAGSCRITVNCSIQDDWVTSLCDAHGCKTSQESVQTFNISIFTERRTAVCRGNNRVSSSHGSVNIDHCVSQANVEHKKISQKHLIVIIVATVCLVLLVCVVVLAQRLHYCCQRPTAPLIQSQPVETPSLEEAAVSTPSSSQAEPCYENVEQSGHTGSPSQQPGSLASPTADSVYSFPNPTAPAPAGGGDSSGQESAAAAPQSVPAQTQQASQVDTVYCLLQRPGNVK